MSTKKWSKTSEVKIVSKKVQETKKEIEQLKTELEKLINTGIKQSNVAANQNVQQIKENTTSKLLTVNITESRSRSRTRSITNSPKKRKNVSNEAKVQEESPKKVRHYNPEEAREFIRKQKEKRLEQKLQTKENQNMIDERKQKLKDLHQKSLQLVNKNVQFKRERSKSRDKSNNEPQIIKKKTMESPTQLVPDLIPVQINPQQMNKKINLLSAHPNITFRNIPENIPLLNIPTVASEDSRQKAAITIQRIYRGYQQRKLYSLAIKMKRKLEEEARKLAEEAIQRNQKKIQIEERPAKKPLYPVWLHPPSTVSHPYNFINTVKRKLNIAANTTPKLSSDVAVQISIQDTPEHDQSCSLSKKEIKQLLINSIKSTKSNNLKSFLSHNVLDVKLKEPPENNSKLESDSDTSKNIPDISSESVSKSKKIAKITTESSDDSDLDFKLEINSERLKKLRLEHGFRNNDSLYSLIENEDKLKSLNESERSKSSRDSIIASNRSIRTNRSEILDKTESNITKREPVSENLQSFLEYMDNFNKTPKTPKIKSSLSENTNKSKESSIEESIAEKSRSKSKQLNSIPTETITSNKYSSNFTDARTKTSLTKTEVPSLKRPSISLQSSQMYKTNESETNKSKTNESETNESEINEVEKNELDTNKIQNITLKEGGKISTITNSNQIHLKFEAELHLLNDFNKSLRQFITAEKSLLEVQNKNLNNINRDTQSSLDEKKLLSSEAKISKTKSITDEEVEEDMVVVEPENKVKNINYSRGCDDLIQDNLNLLSLNNSFIEQSEPTMNTTGLELSRFNDTVEASLRNNEISLQSGNMYAGLSLGMFDQLIKDEDARLENLKTILKIREKALLDRTKGELAWLEIQKKHLKETGQLNEVSLVKKKQRGIIIKLQHEKHEMQRLKQMQKAASEERKTILKEQRNFIKAQLATNNMMTKIKRSGPKERRQSGPFKVYNVHTHRETVTSETSVSKRNSVTEEIVSYASRSHSHSVVSTIAEDIPTVPEDVKQEMNVPIRTHNSHNSEHAKRSLLMREAALQKRRKAAEELLQWHQRLLEEEKKIADLEMAANSVINQFSKKTTPTSPSQEKYKLKGEQLNLLWRNMTAREENKFNDNETYSVSQIALERFCKDAKKYSKTKPLSISDERISESDSTKLDASKTPTTYNYTSEFETVPTENPPTVVSRNKLPQDHATSSLSEIIQNISNISNEISVIHELSTITSLSENVKGTKQIQTSKDNSATKSLELILSQLETESPVTTSNQVQPAWSGVSSPVSNSNSFKTNISIENVSSNNERTNSTASKRSSSTKETKAKRSKQSTEPIASQFSGSGKISNDSAWSKPKRDVASNKSSFHSEIEQNSTIGSDQSEILEEDLKSRTNSIINKDSEVGLKVSAEDILEEYRIAYLNVKDDSHVESKISEEDSSENKIYENSIQTQSIASNSKKDAFETKIEEDSEGGDLETGSSKEDLNLSKENSSENKTENYSLDKPNLSKEKSFISEIEEIPEDADVKSIFSNLSLEKSKRSETSEDSKTNDKIESELSVNDSFKNSISKYSVNEDSLKSKTKTDSQNTNDIKSFLKHSLDVELKPSERLDVEYSDSKSFSKHLSEIASILYDENSFTNKTQNDSKTSDDFYLKQSVKEDSTKDKSEVQTPLLGINLKLSKTDSSDNKTEEESKTSNLKSLSKHSLRNNSQSYPKTSVPETFSLNASIKLSDEDSVESKKQNYSNTTDTKSLSKHYSKENYVKNKTQNSPKISEMQTVSLEMGTKLSKTDSFISKTQNDSKTSIVKSLSKDSAESNILSYQKTSDIQTLSLEQPEEESPKTSDAKSFSKHLLKEDSVENIKSYPKTSDDETLSLVLPEDFSKSKTLEGDIKSISNFSLQELSAERKADGNDSKTSSVKSFSKHSSESNFKIQLEPSEIFEGAGSFEKNSNESSKKALVSEKSDILDEANNLKSHFEDSKQLKRENEDSSKQSLSEALDLSASIKSNDSKRNKNKQNLDSIESSLNGNKSHKDTISNVSEIHSEQATLQKESNENNTSEEDVSEIQISSNKSSPVSYNALQLASKRSDESKTNESNRLEADIVEEEAPKTDRSEGSVTVTEKADTQLSLSYGIVQEDSAKRSVSEEDSHSKLHVDVKKRISEILADAQTSSRSEKSPRLQDLYCTTYDLNSPELSPETGSPVEPLNKEILSAKFGDEAEELLKKQLAIEQEIKQLEQQQKEHIPYLYVREIPNKPPPPYTPPSTQQIEIPPSILPSSIEQVECMTETISEVLYNAHQNNQLFDLKFPEALINNTPDKNVSKACYELVFDLCKEIARDHFKQFESEPGPAWFKLNKKSSLLFRKQPNKNGLEKRLKEKLKEILGFKKVECKQSNIIKWNHKKRDHVDELLILESQVEESEWTNYDYDELIVKNDVTNDIMNILLNETADVMSKILLKNTTF